MSIKRKPIIEGWPGPWKRWAEKYCNANLWRVRSVVGDMDDAMAECAVQFIECRRRYGALVDNPAWLMALYQLCVISRFNDLSVKASKYKDLIILVDDLKVDYSEDNATFWDTPNLGNKHSKVKVACVAAFSPHDVGTILCERTKNASDELKTVLGVIFNAPTEVIQGFSEGRTSSKKFFYKIASSLGITDSKKIANELHNLLR